MEAKVFQEQNAFTLLDEGTAEVDAAKVAYQAADTGEAKTAAVTAWQAGMDKLNEIPPRNLSRAASPNQARCLPPRL
jgi:predicted P-loop ATPase